MGNQVTSLKNKFLKAFTGLLLLVSLFLFSGYGTNQQIRTEIIHTEVVVKTLEQRGSKTISFKNATALELSRPVCSAKTDYSRLLNKNVIVKFRQLRMQFNDSKSAIALQTFITSLHHTDNFILGTA